MLPYLDCVQAESRIDDFSQLRDFPLNSCSDTVGGACVGISMDWIYQHSIGSLNAFVSEITTPARLGAIQNLQFIYNQWGWAGSLEMFFHENNIPLKVVDKWLLRRPLLSHRYIAESITEHKGYLLIGYSYKNAQNNRGRHAVAAFNDDAGYEFFDSNYGSAFFYDKKQFLNWYDLYIYNELIAGKSESSVMKSVESDVTLIRRK